MKVAQCHYHLRSMNNHISLFRLFAGSFHRYFPLEFSRKSFISYIWSHWK